MGYALIITRFCWSHNWRFGLMIGLFWPPLRWLSLPHHRKSLTQEYSGYQIRRGLFRGWHETGEPMLRRGNNLGAKQLRRDHGSRQP